MAVIESWFEQDLKKPVKVHMIDGNVFSQDNKANRIGVTVFDDGAAASLGGSITANIIRADNGTVAATGTLSGNKCSVLLPAAAYAVTGRIIIVLKLTTDSVITTLLAVVANVYQSSTNTVVDPGTIIPSVQDLISQIETAVASIPADYSSLWTTLAPAFSSSVSYTPGQYVTYGGGLYICTTAHTGSWNASHFSAVSVGGEFSRLDKTISDKEYKANVKELSEKIFEETYTYQQNRIAFTAGSGMASSQKLIDVDIANGDEYSILINDPNGCMQANTEIHLYEIDSQGVAGDSVGRIYVGVKKTLTASKNVKGFSIYVTSGKVVNSGDAFIAVYSSYQENSGTIEEIAKNATPQNTFDKELYEDMKWEIIPTINGSFAASGLTTNNPKRLRTDLIQVRIGDVIVISNGSLKHSCGAWNGTVSAANCVRNDNSWNAEDETITSEINGYYVVVFAKQDATQAISTSDYDGTINQYKSNIYKNKSEIDTLKQTAVLKNGIGQVQTLNLADYSSNIMLFEDEHIVSGTGGSVYEVILNYLGPFAVGEEYTMGADSVEGATASDPFVIYHMRENGTQIRQTGHTTQITTTDIEAGLYRLAFGLRPTTGTPMPTGEAVYTKLYICKGTEIEKSLRGDLREAVENIAGQNTANVPEWFTANNYIENKANRINEVAQNADDAFIFISDIHWERNARHSPDLIQYIASKCNIPKLIDGGDVADRIIQSACDKYRNAFKRRIYRAVGNHDRFPPITGKNLYYAFDILNNEQIGNASDHYYYVDNVQQKIRYVVLNAFYHEGSETGTGWSYYDEDQIDWFSNKALDTPDTDWDVIVVTHYLKTASYLTGGAAIGNAIDTFNAQSGHTGKVLAVFQGHTHWDGIYHTTGGVPIITITCDKWDLSNETSTIPAEGIAWREKDTIKEQAFDVVILNRDSRKFTCVRIGAPAQNNIDKYRTDSGFTWIGTLEEREITY